MVLYAVDDQVSLLAPAVHAPTGWTTNRLAAGKARAPARLTCEGSRTDFSMSDISADRVPFDTIRAWRDAYREEMACQIVLDSVHTRPGWSQEYRLAAGGTPVGYASLAVGGPWTDEPTAYELYVEPAHRTRLFDSFRTFLQASGAVAMEVQSNDRLAAAMLHTFATNVVSGAILFHDGVRTSHVVPGATFRHPTEAEEPDLPPPVRRWCAVVELDGAVAGTGGILFHYNPPYGDIYMDVAEPFRRRGVGAFLVQELKRLAYEGGRVPAARCNPDNIASRRTLQKAGLVPCGHLLKGSLAR